MTPRARVVIAKALGADHEVFAATTTKRGHATELAEDAVKAGANGVVVLGGDGTLNEVACALAGTELKLGVLPGGSTNVFARSLGMSDDPVEATGQLLDALQSGESAFEHMSLGKVNGRFFVFHTGIGFDAAVVSRVERRGHLKRWASHPLFVWSAFSTWAAYDRTARFTVTSRDLDHSPSPLTLVLNRDPYTYLGERAVRVAVDADFSHGLTVVCFGSLRLVSVMAAAARALFRQGGLESGGVVTIRHGQDRVSIESSRPVAFQVDGDYMGESASFEIKHIPHSLWVVRPRTDTPS